jgi:hypothetical protein
VAAVILALPVREEATMRDIVICKSEVWILTAVVVGLLSGFALRPGTDLAYAGPGASRVITLDYGNTFFKKAKTPSPSFEIVRVYDLRGGPHDAAGTTRSEEGDDRVPLALSEPVSDFVRRGLDMMLSSHEETDHPIKVEVGIEQFEANFEKVFLGNKCHFLARIEVKIVSDIGSTTVVLGTESYPLRKLQRKSGQEPLWNGIP